MSSSLSIHEDESGKKPAEQAPAANHNIWGSETPKSARTHERHTRRFRSLAGCRAQFLFTRETDGAPSRILPAKPARPDVFRVEQLRRIEHNRIDATRSHLFAQLIDVSEPRAKVGKRVIDPPRPLIGIRHRNGELRREPKRDRETISHQLPLPFPRTTRTRPAPTRTGLPRHRPAPDPRGVGRPFFGLSRLMPECSFFSPRRRK